MNKEFKDIKKFLTNNKRAFSKASNSRPGNVLTVIYENEPYFVISLLKIAKSLSMLRKHDLIVLNSIKSKKETFEIIKSFNVKTIVSGKLFISIFIVLASPYYLVALMFRRTGCYLEKLSIGGVRIGPYIYDQILRKHGLYTISTIKLQYYQTIMLGIAYFYFYKYHLRSNNIKYVVSLDNVYIEGILFELAKHYHVPCITGIDVNGVSAHYYDSPDSYKYHCRMPDSAIINKDLRDMHVQKQVRAFMEKRFSGQQQQHDAIRAFSPRKRHISREELMLEYELDNSLKNILILPHIFQDAVHGYPDVFFQDYYYWLTGTIDILTANQNVNIIIKEHPSVDIYGEYGFLATIISKYNSDRLKLIDSDINTIALASFCDVLITCGGTAGMEFASQGVPVVLSSRAPYSDYGFVQRARTMDEYIAILSRIDKIKPLTQTQQKVAALLLFTINKKNVIDKKELGLGRQIFSMDVAFNYSEYYNEISSYNSIVEGNIKIESALKNMLNSDLRNLF